MTLHSDLTKLIETCRLECTTAEQFAERILAEGWTSGAALDINGPKDAYHNLGGAIIDIERRIVGTQDGKLLYICDQVCMNTLKRVERQLGAIRATTTEDCVEFYLALPTPPSGGTGE